MEVLIDNGVSTMWFHACNEGDVPENGGVCVKYKDQQIAIFRFSRRNEWYASQNLCPHRQQMALSRGMTGSQDDQPKIACPFHKKTFSLSDGHCMNDESCPSIQVYQVRLHEGKLFISIPELLNDTL
jgi:nitrite reductase (NADH) small subunit